MTEPTRQGQDMTDMPVKERLARILAKRFGDHCDFALYVDDVDAILDALMEPTEGMRKLFFPNGAHQWRRAIQHIKDGGS